MSVRDDAVEAAAIAEFYAMAGPVTWEELDESWRDHYRKKISAHVLVTLGVVADHCTTEAHKAWEWASLHANDIDLAAQHGRVRKAMTLTDVAAELRETPE